MIKFQEFIQYKNPSLAEGLKDLFKSLFKDRTHKNVTGDDPLTRAQYIKNAMQKWKDEAALEKQSKADDEKMNRTKS